jgi:hypothetical protein
MVANGHERAMAYSIEAITRRWAELLFETIPGVLERRTHRVGRALPTTVMVPLRRAPPLAP